MAINLATAYIEILPSIRGVQQNVAKELGDPLEKAAAEQGKKTGSLLSSGIGKALTGAGAALAAKGLFDIGKGALDAATESAKVAAQSVAAVKSTGGAAGITAGQVGDLAHRLQNLSGIQDEAIQTGANMLLTFTNIKNGVGKGNQIFDEATLAMTNMAARMGGDTQGAAIQLGKALNDPIAGISALSRVGVSFTDQQKAQIKALVDSGKTMDAQKIILGELNTEFGGSAKALGDARSPAEKFGLAMGDLQENIGTLLLPVVSGLTSGINDSINAFVNAPGPVKVLIGVVAGLAGGLLILSQVQKVVTATQALFAEGSIASTVASKAAAIASKAWAAAQWLLNAALDANPIVLVGIAIAALVAGFILAYKHSQTFRDIVQSAMAVVGGAVRDVLGVFEAIGSTVARVIGGAVKFLKDHWEAVLVGILTGPIGLAVIFVSQHLDDIVGFVKDLPGKIASAGAGMWDWILDALKSALRGVVNAWNALDLKFTVPNIPGVPERGKTFDLIPDVSMPSFLQPKDQHVAGSGTITRFHEGGVVPGLPGQEMLALLRAGETVLPPDWTRSLSAGIRSMQPPAVRDARSQGGNLIVEHLEVHGSPEPQKSAVDICRELRSLNHLVKWGARS